MLENEVEEPTSESSPSSPESSPIMTPETSDDEDESVLHLPEARYESSDEDELQLDTPAATPEYVGEEGKDLLHMSATTLEKSEDEGENLHPLPDATPEGCHDEGEDLILFSGTSHKNWEDEGQDLVDIPERPLKGSNNNGEDLVTFPRLALSSSDSESNGQFPPPDAAPEISSESEDFNELVAPELYYGVLLSSIREVDRTALEGISPAAIEQSRGRMRVHRELKSLHEDETVPYLSVSPIDGNLGNCLACMEGAPDTPLEGGIFWLHIDYPEDYPLKPPIITFLTPVYHPNIDQHGRICIDILEKAWSPCLQTQTILLSILSVLHHPIVDNDDALVHEIAQKYLLDNADYCDIVRIYTASASGLRPDTSNLVNLTAIDSSLTLYQTTNPQTPTPLAND